VQERQTCNTSHASSSKFFIIGVSLASVIIVIIVVSIATVIRNRLRARDADRDGILLEDVNPDSDSDENVNHGGNSFAVNSSAFIPQPFGNVVGTQPMVYPTPGWGGQPLQTTPMVLMTQTGVGIR